MKWNSFYPEKYGRQKLPAERKCVLLAFAKTEENPAHCVVGYLRYGGGDPQSPYFVVPYVGGVPTHWCDCLPDVFRLPHWELPISARGFPARYSGKSPAQSEPTEREK